MSLATIADLLLPVYSGRLVDALAARGAGRAPALHAAILVISATAVLGTILVIARYLALLGSSASPCA